MSLVLYTLQDAERIIAANIHKMRHIDTVIGVPRSGSIFASFIATQLGCSLADVTTAGRSMKVAKHGHVINGDLGNVLLVEDVVNRGIAIAGALDVLKQTAPNLPRERITTCSIWTNPKGIHGAVELDLGGHHAERYAFTWQMWHSTLIPMWAMDMDGVLCEEPPLPTNTDEAAYRTWIKNAVGRWLPRPRNAKYKIGAVITSRPEGVRAETEAWLARHGVLYERLIMAPGETQTDTIIWLTRKGLSRGAWKGSELAHYPGVELFIESSPRQSLQISRTFPGLVWCTDTQQRFKNGAIL